MRFLYLWMLVGLIQVQTLFGAEAFAPPEALPQESLEEGAIAQKAKDLLLLYSLQQQEVDQQASTRQLYWGGWAGVPFMSLKNKQELYVYRIKNMGLQLSLLIGGKVNRLLGELSYDSFVYPKYCTASTARQVGIGSTTPNAVQHDVAFDGMFLFIDRPNFQLFGLGGLSFLHLDLFAISPKKPTKLIPRLGGGLFYGDGTIGLCARLLTEVTGTRYSSSHRSDHPCQWSKPVIFQIGFRRVFLDENASDP